MHQVFEELNATKPTKGRRRRAGRSTFGSVRRLPSGRYQARYTDARQRSHSAPNTFLTAKAAHDWLAEVRADMVRGSWRAPELGAVSFGDYAAAHLATRLDLAPGTRALYASVLNNWLASPLAFPCVSGRRPREIDLGTVELRKLTLADVRDWYAAALHKAERNAEARAEAHDRSVRAAAIHDARSWARAHGHEVKETGRIPQRVLDAWRRAGSPAAVLFETGTAVNGVPFGVANSLGATARARQARTTVQPGPTRTAGRAQVAQAYRLAHMILAHAVREGRIVANPCQIPGAGQVKAAEREPATPAQVQVLADAMPERYRAAVHLAAWSGLRRGELFGLARRHVRLDIAAGVGTVRVERAVVTIGGREPFLGPTKTDASRRTVHLPPHVVSILGQHMERFAAPEPDALVFTDDEGRMIRRQVREAFWRARARVGRPDLRWHDLRHTGATWAAQAGATLRELQHRLGHSTTAAAMIYQHHSADRDRDLAVRMAALLSAASEPSPADEPHSSNDK
jgi:integrase